MFPSTEYSHINMTMIEGFCDSGQERLAQALDGLGGDPAFEGETLGSAPLIADDAQHLGHGAGRGIGDVVGTLLPDMGQVRQLGKAVRIPDRPVTTSPSAGNVCGAWEAVGPSARHWA